jgi:hypothetical protein
MKIIRKMNELIFIRSGTVCSKSSVYPGAVFKKRKGTLNYVFLSKKMKIIRKMNELTFVRSGIICSETSVCPDAISKKKIFF